MKTKKVILFIVEGLSEEDALYSNLKVLLNPDIVSFHIIYGDLTSEINNNSQNIITKIHEQVLKFINKNKFKKSDVIEIIHLVDTDGVFIDDSLIIKNNKIKCDYYLNKIETANIQNIKDRNKRKSSILNRIINLPQVANIPYSLYYFSCNLDHVLHNEPNLNSALKCKYAEEFSDRYENSLNEFIVFFNDAQFAVNGNINETWDFIKNNNNSLKRFSNFHIYLNMKNNTVD